ncbi:MAG: hypothetical protein EXS64_09390 [Candidatus Latescibacteria bacterium]|nr:hypothetical protein [Candidatus Latescibacterota bacterium]
MATVTDTKPKTEIIPLQSNYWELYPRREEIALASVKQVSEGLGVLLSLRTSVKDFAHYLCSQNGEAPQESGDGEVTVRFRRLGDAKPQHITTEIQAVSVSGEKTRPHKITIGYYPKELYAASGQTAPNWVIVGNTDLALSRTTVEDWIVDLPPEEDRAYARERWGGLLEGCRSEHEKAQALARSIMIALKPHGGIPSDVMRASPPFQQFERAISGQDRVWCGNHAAIFSWACNALGVPARRIGMNHPYGSDGDHNLLLAEGHSTTEIFDETLNRWVWVDLTFNVLGVYLPDQGPVNMAEMVQNLNDGGRIRALTVVEFDPASGEERRLPATESRKKASLFHYFKRDQQFRYTRRS